MWVEQKGNTYRRVNWFKRHEFDFYAGGCMLLVALIFFVASFFVM